MSDINLLPFDLKPKESFLKISKVLKKFSLALFFLTFVALLISIGTILFLLYQVKNSKDKQQELTQNIRSLNQSEQQLIFLKDRIKKYNSVKGIDSTDEESLVLSRLYNILPPDLVISSLEMDVSSLVLELTASNSLTVKNFLDSLRSFEEEVIVLENLNYKNGSYTVKLEILT